MNKSNNSKIMAKNFAGVAKRLHKVIRDKEINDTNKFFDELTPDEIDVIKQMVYDVKTLKRLNKEYGDEFPKIFIFASQSPLCLALLYKSLVTAELLIRLGVDVNLPNGRLGTALYTACKYGDDSIIKVLFEHGA